MGAPGIGKSSFIKNVIYKKQIIKSYSTDDTSLVVMKDPNKYYPKAAELTRQKIRFAISNGNSFIYDTTGTERIPVTDVIMNAKENGYYVLIIHIFGSFELAKKQNLKRDRNVDDEYLKIAYQNQQSNIRYYLETTKPDAYYIVYKTEYRLDFYKFVNGVLKKKKGDKYSDF
jgi:predicted ABC-type ATPase